MFVLAAFSGTEAFSQVYIKVNAGYGFSMGDHGILSNYEATNNGPNTTYRYESVKLSFGKGVNFGGAIGLMFGENIGAELGLNYLVGGKTKTTDTYGNSPDPSVSKTTISANMLRIMPTLILSAGKSGVNPYAKFGLVIGTGKIVGETVDDGAFGQYISGYEYSGGVALGFNSAFGVDFSLNDKMNFFAELSYIGMSYAPTKGELVKSSLNGEDDLSTMSTNERKIEFVDEYTEVAGAPDSGVPDKQLRQSYPFSSIGFNLGVKFSF